MIRRELFRRTLGAIAGAVCAPFVGKAAESRYVIVCDVATGSYSDFVVYTYALTDDGVYRLYMRGR